MPRSSVGNTYVAGILVTVASGAAAARLFFGWLQERMGRTNAWAALGLMLLVINALMLLLTSAVAGSVSLGFHVDGFGTAVLGSIVISIASMVLAAVLPDGERR